MLNRRILRIKAFKIIYGYAVNGRMSLEDALSELDKSCEAARDLYLFMLALIPPLTQVSRSRIEAGRSKFNPNEEELNPNEKFAYNALAKLFSTDPDFTKIIAKRKLSWEQYDILLRKIMDSVSTKDYYKKYMANPETSLKEDVRLFIRIFEEELVGLEELERLLEDLSIYWIDDLAYSLTYCCRTLKDLANGEQWRLPELYSSEMVLKKKPGADVASDRAFVRKLLRAAFTGYEKYFEAITKEVPDWEGDRLFSTDIALIALGMAEAQSFEEIPIRVTLNEYVEISKYYSSPKSRVFVNGLLDKMIKENNILNKPI